MTLTPELLLQLANAGARVDVAADGSFTVIGDSRPTPSKRRSARNRRYYERRKASPNALKTSENRLNPSTTERAHSQTSHSDRHHGIHLWEIPGKTNVMRRLNLSLFKRGELSGFESCKGLEGRDLRREFDRIKAKRRNRAEVKQRAGGQNDD